MFPMMDQMGKVLSEKLMEHTPHAAFDPERSR
jgi:hypothetical protein